MRQDTQTSNFETFTKVECKHYLKNTIFASLLCYFEIFKKRVSNMKISLLKLNRDAFHDSKSNCLPF